MKLIRMIVVMLAFSLTLPAFAQSYPARPVRMIVPYPAGGYYDLVARLISQHWSETYQQPMVVENRVGANGIIGTESVARAAPDGYTLILGGIGPHGINPALYPKLPYDAVRDFAPIIAIASQPNVLVVHPNFPAKSVRALIDLAKSRPGQIAYASNGVGSSNHLCMELFAIATGIKLNHIPFKGASPAVAATLAGEPPIHFGTPTDLIPLMKAQRLVGIATSGEERAPGLAEYPLISEVGVPGYGCFSWSGVFAPAAAPRDVIDKVNAEVNRILRLPSVRERLAPGGTSTIIGGPPAALDTLVKSEITKWTKVIRESKIQAN